MENIKEIEIKHIKDLIPKILYNKLVVNNFLTVNDVLNCNEDFFSKHRYVGIKVVAQFAQLKNDIKINPEKYTNEFEKNRIKIIPIHFDTSNHSENFILTFEQIVEDFLNIIENFNSKTTFEREKNKRNVSIIRKSYGFKSVKYSRDRIATRHRIKPERVRQVVESEFKENIITLIKGEVLNEWKCSCNPEALIGINSFFKELAGKSVVNLEQIKDLISDFGILDWLPRQNYLESLLNVLGYKELKTSRYYYLRNNHIYANEGIDKDIFPEVACLVISFLQKNVIPVPFDDIVIEVLEKIDCESDDLIRLVCESVIEIEKVGTDSYQIKFEY